jgi:TPR repeat protein
MSKIKVLFFTADPRSVHGQAARLLLDEDVRQIQQKVRAAEYRDALEFKYRLAARADDLLQALNEVRPQVVHFSGHGGPDGLVLASTAGTREHTADAAVLSRLFRVFRGDIRVVVLNACTSLPQAQAIADVVGCAIGTPDSISDEAAIAFGASFYRAIAFGESVQAAYEQACLALDLEHVDDRECPVLVAREDVDPAELVLVSPDDTDSGARVTLETATPPRDDATPQERNPRPPTAPPALTARGRRWGGVAVVAATLVSGAFLLHENPRVQVPCARDAGLRGALGIAAGLSGAKSTPSGASFPAPGGPATASGAPGDPAPAELAAAKDLYKAGNFTAAFPLFQDAAKAGNVEAKGFVGDMYLNGQGTVRNDSLAIVWLREAVEKRDPRAMHGLGASYEMDRRYHLAEHWYEAAVEEHAYAPAMSSLARMYTQGLGVKANRETALDLYQKAANAGHVDAMVDAGAIHQRGLLGAPNVKEAVRLYCAAVAEGSARGMFAIGRTYQEGDGVARDYEEARHWYEKGVDAGSAEAMNNLGVLHQNGWGVPPSHAEAARWFSRAAEAGSTVAAGNLARLRGG